MDLGPLWDYLVTVQNLIVMVACGVLMEAFKRGPLTSEFAQTKWGKAGAYYAPYFWGVLAEALPIGLAPADSGWGAKIMLGVILGGTSSKVYDTFVVGTKKLLSKTDKSITLDK